MKIALAADHAGYELKENLKNYLESKGYSVVDYGTHSAESSDYADYAHPMAMSVENGESTFGISICGSGNGINMTVNKHPKIRSALCWNIEIAELARRHNDANICALPARFISYDLACSIADKFLSSSFDGGRHQARIDKIPLK
ncbi:MAG: ribose 5-phosphate isomerase B [Bacteroidales bacterium]